MSKTWLEQLFPGSGVAANGAAIPGRSTVNFATSGAMAIAATDDPANDKVTLTFSPVTAGVSSTTANFVQPAPGSAVNVAVGSSNAMAVGLSAYVGGGGVYAITAIPDSTHVTLRNPLGDTPTGQAATGATIASGASVIPGAALTSGACAATLSNTAPGTLNLTTEGTRDWFAPAGETQATPGAIGGGVTSNSGMHAKARGGWILRSFQWCCRVGTQVVSGTGPTTVSATLADDVYSSASSGLSTASASYVYGAFSNSGWGYRFRAPASKTTRTLKVCGRVVNSDAVLTARASDGSFVDVVSTASGNTGTTETVWTITYNTAHDGEEIIIEVVCSNFYASGPQVWLIAATLS